MHRIPIPDFARREINAWWFWLIAAAAVLLGFGPIAASFAALTYAFVNDDFSLQLVWANSHTLQPMLYKVSGVWGNHEGSMVLWVLILALFGAALATNDPSTQRAIA